ncbi:Thiol-disulfide oxidoreductase ResA [Variovorax sp. SRS16]|uniref:TlpA family protein disulfide reductase n=1 Tax=Variovorax sp. SRS16 TaxID=282217 RepID=UPI001316D8D7|nr:TlpA disulfide reductase family protein [Variovorax sp. SRS16]VTU14113.1 Thiol-disulfide oxidoreductase ResA [Variovorax sp. SRS16]
MTSSPTRRGLIYGGVAAIAAAAGLGGALWRHDAGASGGEKLGADFWSRRFDRPEGGELLLANLRGKPLLVNFWATWCPPCVEEMPMIDAFFRENSVNGWQVIGLAIDQPSAVRKFLVKTPVTYPIGLAGLDGTELVKQLGNSAGGLPFSFVVAADGSVSARKMGKLEPSDFQAWHRV